MPETERILGIPFFNGTATDAIRFFLAEGGCLVVTAATALTKLRHDEDYRRALQQADVVLPDSGLLAFMWRAISGRRLRKVSGVEYLTSLLDEAAFRREGETFWVVSSFARKTTALEFLRAKGLPLRDDDVYDAANLLASGENHALLLKIEERRLEHIVIALRTGTQEPLGIYLRDFLLYRPRIHCVGSALDFLTGGESHIPEALERRHLGWLSRLVAQPSLILPRLGIALTLALTVLRYRAEPPVLKPRWSDM